MEPVRDWIDSLRAEPRVSVVAGPVAWSVAIPRGDVVFTLTVPHDVLEWFVEATTPAGAILWRDWVDHYGSGPHAGDELAVERASSLATCLRRVLEGQLKLEPDREEGSSVRLLWRPDDRSPWAQLSLQALLA